MVGAKAIKKFIMGIFCDPEKLIKLIILFFMMPLILLLLFFTLPTVFVTSIPSILMDSGEADLTNKQLELIAIYQEVPAVIDKSNSDWIENKKKSYSSYDDIVVKYNFDLSWQALMAIDSVRYEQDFNNVKRKDIIKLGERFPIRNVHTETYEEQETYTDKENYQVKEEYQDIEEYQVTETYEEWEYYVPSMHWLGGRYVTKTRTVTKTRPVTKVRDITKTKDVTKTKTVTKKRAIIEVTSKTFNQVLHELNFNQDDIEIANNIYNTIITSDVAGNIIIDGDIKLGDLKEYPAGNANLPYFNQKDKRWGAYSYGNTQTIANAGCGPTALAMVVAGLTGRIDINPKSVADWSVANGYMAEGHGSYWSLMPNGGKNYGLQVDVISRKNPQKIVESLSKGYPIIAIMGRGHFTTTGHFIVLRGITSDGKILVHDPYSVNNSNKEWDLSIIMNESSTSGGVNGNPFWVFKP